MPKWIQLVAYLILVCTVVWLLAGCTTAGAVKDQALDSARKVNDEAVVLGQTLTCGASMPAVMRAYGGEPAQLLNWLRFCRFYDYMEAAIKDRGQGAD